MKKKEVEKDDLIENASRVASCISIFLIIASTTMYIFIGLKINHISHRLYNHAKGFEASF